MGRVVSHNIATYLRYDTGKDPSLVVAFGNTTRAEVSNEKTPRRN